MTARELIIEIFTHRRGLDNKALSAVVSAWMGWPVHVSLVGQHFHISSTKEHAVILCSQFGGNVSGDTVHGRVEDLTS